MSRPVTTNSSRSRYTAGFTMIEAAVALAFLAVLTTLAAQMCGAMIAQRKTLERNRVVRTTESNLMSVAMALPYEQLTPTRVQQIAQDWDLQDLTKGEWRISVNESFDQGQRSKRIAITLEGGPSQSVRPRQLVAWRYPIVQEGGSN